MHGRARRLTTGPGKSHAASRLACSWTCQCDDVGDEGDGKVPAAGVCHADQQLACGREQRAGAGRPCKG